MYIAEPKIEVSNAVYAEVVRNNIGERVRLSISLASQFGAANWVPRVRIMVAYGS